MNLKKENIEYSSKIKSMTERIYGHTLAKNFNYIIYYGNILDLIKKYYVCYTKYLKLEIYYDCAYCIGIYCVILAEISLVLN